MGNLNTGDCLALKDGAYRLSRNVGNKLPISAGLPPLHPRGVNVSQKISIHVLRFKILRSEYKLTNVNMYVWVGCDRLTIDWLCYCNCLRGKLTLRRLMSYIYIYIYIYMEHPFLMFLDHTQRRSTVGRTPLDE